jgi:hypothetical protein
MGNEDEDEGSRADEGSPELLAEDGWGAEAGSLKLGSWSK